MRTSVLVRFFHPAQFGSTPKPPKNPSAELLASVGRIPGKPLRDSLPFSRTTRKEVPMTIASC